MDLFGKQSNMVTAFWETVATALALAMLYILLEPTVMMAQSATNTFTITQEVSAEISFSTAATDFTMSGAIGGSTGGTANGSTTVGITTNNSAGYTLTIQFATTTGMVKNGTGPDAIAYYATTTPDYTMNLGTANSGFAYSVSSAAPTNSVTAFNNDGVSCGTGSNKSIDNCFVMQSPQTSPSTIVSTSDTANDELTTIGFKVIIAAGAGIPNGFYYATTTLTATVK